MYFYISILDDLKEVNADVVCYKNIDGGLMVRKDVEVGKRFIVYKAKDYNGVISDRSVDQTGSYDSFTDSVSCRVILKNDVKLEKYCSLVVTGERDLLELTSVFDTDPNGNKHSYTLWNYDVESNDSRLLIECACMEVEAMINVYDSTKNITESIEGVLLILIPKLIKLILIIIGKIAYLLAIPLVNALIKDTKNIRRTGDSVLRGETSMGEVVSSINYADVRSAVVAASKGDAAEFVSKLDSSLADVKTAEVKKISETIIDDGHIYDNLGKHNKDMIQHINSKLRSELKIVKFIDDSQIKVLTDSLEMLKDENLIHTDVTYIAGINDSILSEFESKNHRYDLVFMDKYVDKVDILVEYLEKVSSVELVDEVREDTHNNKKVFNSYYLDCVAPMNNIKEFLPPELFSDHFRVNNEGKVMSNLKSTSDRGDFEHLKNTGKIQKKTVLEVLKECKGDLDDLNAATIRIFGFYAGHINNKNNESEINKRRDNIKATLDNMQERIEALNPAAIGNGIEHSYVVALLDFLRTDLTNVMNTIKTSKIYFMDNHEAMMDVVDIMSEEIIGTYMYLILDDIVRNPNIYKATDTAMQTIVAMYRDRGGHA